MSHFFRFNGRMLRLSITRLLFFAMLVQPALAAGDAALTLAEATRLTLQHNPELQGFKWQLQAADGKRQRAGLAPGLSLGLEADNVVGSNNYGGVDQGEFTLSLASVIELGGQRDARVALMESSYALIEAEQKAKTLDLLGQLTRAFVRTLAQQQQVALASAQLALADDALRLIRQRVSRGAAPDAERLRAQAEQTRARLTLASARAEAEVLTLALARFWGAPGDGITHLDGDLFAFVAAPTFEVLLQRASNTPAIKVFASQRRLREASLDAAQRAGGVDIGWQLGVKRLAATDDTALTAGLSVPLFAGRRQQGEVLAARAELAALENEQKTWQLAFNAQLFAAWQDYQQGVKRARTLADDVIPLLQSALTQTRRAYERGADSYSNWLAARRELLSARSDLIDSASAALLAQSLIEQLTNAPLSTTAAARH